MSYWLASIPFAGQASIAIEVKDVKGKKTKPPKMDVFRRYLQRDEVNLGVPEFYTMKGDIEETDKDIFTRTRRHMFKRKSSISEIADEIIKIASLSGNQRERIVEFVKSDPQMSFQEIANFLSSKVGASPSIIYSFLMSHDHSLTRDNDYLKKS